jgi:transposase
VQDERDHRIAELKREVADLKTLARALLAQNEQLRAENDMLRVQNAELRAENEELRRLLGQNSSNSSKPPSSDNPADRRARRGKGATGKKRGGQPGHKGSQRALLPPTSPPVDCFPTLCRRCERHLPRKYDPRPVSHQTVDLPQIVPVVSEWRLHRVACTCGVVTCAQVPEGVPTGMCGPGLMALIALLTGDYKLSRRRAVSLLSDVLGIEISLGALSEVEGSVAEILEKPCDEARDHVADAPVKHSDATSWSVAGKARTLWTVSSAWATVFFITQDGTMPSLRGIFAKIKGTLVSDRGGQFRFWAMANRQICWAHLIRKFVTFAERKGEVGRLGENLLLLARTMIHYWHNVRDGTLTRAAFQRLMGDLTPT